ncbi:hypothetical protein HT031_000518 [Scenedesmus sp. PABB004]|nr:hypothetical protein HT031_000518 [Scenedesmus sp. PABB004]
MAAAPGAAAPAAAAPPAAAVSALSLEAYASMWAALTKGTGEVQGVTAIEECFYKLGDLRALLALHGLSASKFNRAELLAAMRGRRPICPIHEGGPARALPPAAGGGGGAVVPFAAADLAALGWWPEGLDAASELPVERLPLSPPAGEDGDSGEEPAPPPAAAAPPSQPAAPAAAEAAGVQRQQQEQGQPQAAPDASPTPPPQSAATTPAPQELEAPPGAEEPPDGGDAAAVASALRRAGLLDAAGARGYVRTPWLLQQLRRFAASGAEASAEALPAEAGEAAGGGGPGGLLGRHVGFVLLEDMQPREQQPACRARERRARAAPQGVAVKALGAACQPELCEASCTGGHAHYRARVLPPPRPPPGAGDAAAAAAAEQAAAAARGRPVLLMLDLHPRLRVGRLAALLELGAAQLQVGRVCARRCAFSRAADAARRRAAASQDAWVLLAQREAPGGDDAAGGEQAAAREAAAQPPAKRARA